MIAAQDRPEPMPACCFAAPLWVALPRAPWLTLVEMLDPISELRARIVRASTHGPGAVRILIAPEDAAAVLDLPELRQGAEPAAALIAAALQARRTRELGA